MKAITVEPKKPGTVRYEEFPEPGEREGSILVEAIAAAVCGTDVEIAEGKYGWATPGKTRLVSDTSPSAASSIPAQEVHSRRVTWWPGLSDVRTRCPAPTARWANRTCAGMACTPSGGSKKSTDS